MEKKRLVVLTGAGISAESGLRTFRDGDGLWESHRVEDVATPEAWQRDPELVLRFYNQRRRDVLATGPNKAHRALAELQAHYDVHIVTQNIDDLHERAGSEQVLHLHGEILSMRSEGEGRRYPVTGDMTVGARATDGSLLRPDIVWFGEEVPEIPRAIDIMKKADAFVLIGSSLVVYPAAGLVQYLPDHIPKYIIDRQLPNLSLPCLTCFEKSATEGVDDLMRCLLPPDDQQ